MVVVGALRFARRKRREERATVADFLPPVSVLKPLHGTEPDLEENLRRFFLLDYPEYELLFCARHASDAGLQMAQRSLLPGAYPRSAGEVSDLRRGAVSVPEDVVAGRAELRQHDVQDAGDQLTRTRACRKTTFGAARKRWRTRTQEKLTSLPVYRRTNGGFAAELDAVGKSVEMSGGIFVADMLEGGKTRFALGVSMILRREGFPGWPGGYVDLGQYYAEDFVLGQRLAAQGRGVRMANYVVRLMMSPPPQGCMARLVSRPVALDEEHASIAACGAPGDRADLTPFPFGLLGLAWGLAGPGTLWLDCCGCWPCA